MLYNKEEVCSIGSSSRRTKFHFDRFVQMVLFIAANPDCSSPVNRVPDCSIRPNPKKVDTLEQKIKSLNIALGSKLKEENLFSDSLHNSVTLAPLSLPQQLPSSGKKLSAAHRPKSRKKQTILPNGQPKECATCGDTWTSQWRSGPNGNVELCSRCGIAYRKKMEKKIRQQQCTKDSTNDFLFKNR